MCGVYVEGCQYNAGCVKGVKESFSLLYTPPHYHHHRLTSQPLEMLNVFQLSDNKLINIKKKKKEICLHLFELFTREKMSQSHV